MDRAKIAYNGYSCLLDGKSFGMVPWPFGKDGKALKQARAAVAVAQRVSTLVAVESLCDALDVGLAAPQDPALVLRLLSSLDATARSLLQTMLDTLASSFDNQARFGLWGSRASQLVERMWQSHELLLDHRRGEIDAALLASASFWLAWRMLLTHIAGDAAQEPPWRLLLVCLRARAPLLPPGDQLAEPVRLGLARLILTQMLLRRAPTAEQCFSSQQALDQLAPLLLLHNAWTRATPFALLLDNQGLPQRLEGWQLPGEDGLALFCGFQPLLQALETRYLHMNFIDDDDDVETPSPSPAVAAAPANLAAAVPQLSSQAQAELVILLRQLRMAMLPEAGDLDLPLIPELRTLAAFDFMRIRVLLANPVKATPKRELLIREVEVLGASEEGADLLLDADTDCARLNGLLALHTRGEWWICVIRRLHGEQDGRLFAGLRLLTRNPVPARFLLLSEGERQVLGHAIFLPEARSDRGQLLIAHLQVELGADYILDMERQERAVHIDRLIDAGDGFAQLGISFVGAQAAAEAAP